MEALIALRVLFNYLIKCSLGKVGLSPDSKIYLSSNSNRLSLCAVGALHQDQVQNCEPTYLRVLGKQNGFRLNNPDAKSPRYRFYSSREPFHCMS